MRDIQGDGISVDGLQKIVDAVVAWGFSLENLLFGSLVAVCSNRRRVIPSSLRTRPTGQTQRPPPPSNSDGVVQFMSTRIDPVTDPGSGQ